MDMREKHRQIRYIVDCREENFKGYNHRRHHKKNKKPSKFKLKKLEIINQEFDKIIKTIC
jgi:hypothetical protein